MCYFYGLRKAVLCLALPLLALILPHVTFAQTAFINTTIAVDKTGSEPFDTDTWTFPDLATAGLDEDAENNVVRLQDSITYKVEVSVNDADVDDLTATVKLNEKQKWINIPTGCKTDPADVIAQPVSSISADGTELFCNLGPSIEGTTKVFFPPARVVGVDPATGDITLNNDVVTASVTAGADGNPSLASDGPADTIVTAFFRVNTIKEPKVNAKDPDTGAFLYKAVSKEGPNGEAGWLVEYRISAQYVKGSMIADSDEISFESDYELIDFLTDDNTNNNATMLPTPNPPATTSPLSGPLSSGGLLYTWDASLPACILDGDHGANATIDCVQNNQSPGDFTASNAPSNGYAVDGIEDPNINIDLDKIDVRDPDADGNLFEFVINIWFDQTKDIRSHQNCVGAACTNTVINDIGVYDPLDPLANAQGIVGFNPVSTEDAGSSNLENYNGDGEPLPNRNTYPLSESAPGTYATYKSFFNVNDGQAVPKTADQFVPAGAIIPFVMTVADHRLVDQSKTQMCDKIDTSVYEFVGLSSGLGNLGWIQNSSEEPVGLRLATAGVAGSIIYMDGSSDVDILYSTYQSQPEPVPALVADPTTIAWHTSLRDDTCEDDVNGDGTVNIKLAGMPEPDPTKPIDWYQDPAEMPGGPSDTAKVRVESTYDKAAMTAISASHNRFHHWAEFDVKVKSITQAYGTRNMMPNWMSARRTETADATTYESWLDSSLPVADLEEVSFSTEIRYSDRNILVPSGQSIEKYTEPRGIKVVRAGDVVDFIIEPRVFGLWDPAVDTIRVWDNLPATTDYVVGSEMFSIDGGMTWLSRTDYDALPSPDVTITNAAHGVDADPLDWRFGSVNSGDQLPLIRYQVTMDPTAVSGNFTNTARIYDTGIGEQKQQTYRLTILPEFGLDVVKSVDYPIYQTNEAFEFDLTYKNLGGEAYTSGEFIDVLPYNGDGSGTTSGKASDREPPSNYSGIYELTGITATNGEIVYATSAMPSTINIDPCHESNHPIGSMPSAGDLCFEFYTNATTSPVKNAGEFAGGSATGTGTTPWVACTTLNPLTCTGLAAEDITGIRFEVPALGTSGGETVTIELEPVGNVGGEPNLDALGNVTAAATGDIYTNTFGGRVPDISLNVISNDVSVTVVSGSIGDTVWFDQDGDGEGPAGVGSALDPLEPPIVGAAVALLDATGAPVYVDPDTGGIVPMGYINPVTGNPAIPYVTTTDMDGMYSFDNLPAGTYSVEVTPPAGTVPTYDADGVGTPNISTHNLVPETDEFGQLVDVEDNEEQDFGYRPPLQVGSTVWLDINNDGTQATDGSEPGIAGVTVQLFPVGADPTTATPVDTAVTDANGDYILNTDAPGDYFVYIPVPPATASLSSSDIGTSGADNETDGDDNGLQMAAGDPVQSPVFNLAFGTEPTGADEDGLTGGDQDDGALDGNGDMTVDFGFYPTGSIGDLVFVDIDGDGMLDPADGDAGIGGVTVTLTYTDLDGMMVTLMTTTAIDGSYLFEELPGNVTYTVTVDTSTLPGTIDMDIRQSSDPDGTLDHTSMTTLNIVANEVVDDLDQDFGYVPLGTIGDTIWYDADNDGVQDAGEMGIANVTVQLTPPAGVDLGAGPGMPITTMTDSDGNYLFDNLPVGDYQVDVISGVPAAYVQTGDPDSMLDDSSNVTLALNPSDPTEVIGNLDQDFGYAESVSVGGFIWDDLDGDGMQTANEPPIQGSTVTLLNADGSAVLDFDGNPVLPVVVGIDGQYLFDNLLEGDYKIQVTKPAGYVPSPVQNAMDDDDTENDSNIASEPVTDTYESGVFTIVGSNEPVETGAYVGDDLDDSATVASDNSGNMTIDFGFVKPASIGDRIWLDLDQDGVQDANEDGLAGVTVNLYADTDGDGVISGFELTTPVATASTGPDGEYLFPDLDPGVIYQVGVDVATVPSGYDQTFDEGDGVGATDSLSDPISLTPGEFHDTADFGYAPADGSIGDTIWIDANDDGVFDPGELGLADVTVSITPEPDVDLGNGPGVAITTTTDANGNYLFTGLPLDEAYVIEVDITTLPAGYVASGSGLGDPDVRDGNSTAADNQTTIVLTPDTPVNLDADFGYLPPPGQNNTIGDTIWLDDDGNGSQNGAEAGAAGVTIDLVDPVTGTVLATTVTDANGNYEFTGVPDGVYEVVVTDANGVLAGTQITGDPDGGTLGSSNVDVDSTGSVDTPVVNEDQDFGYQPPASPPAAGVGTIGDTIFFDSDNSGGPDAGEGIAGVIVELYDDNGVLVASTTTDANGNYLFTGLPTSPAGEDYEVRVVTSSLPNGGAGWTNSVDPDSPNPGDNTSSVTLTDAAPENLDQDFGYIGEDNNSLSGTIWSDTNGDGTQVESGTFAGVTVEVRDQNGNVIQVVQTDTNGDYEVTNLPDGIYTVVVTDDNNVLSGFEHTDSPNGTSDTGDQTSKDDTGYVVDLDSGGTDPNPVSDSTGDFGYQPLVTNPITLGSVSAQVINDNSVLINWTTQTEVGNLGFNVYGLVEGEWVVLNDSLIVGQGDAIWVQSYQWTARTQARIFAIGDVDLTGQETLNSPFSVSRIQGEKTPRKAIDWEALRQQRKEKSEQREQARQLQLQQQNQQRRLSLPAQDKPAPSVR